MNTNTKGCYVILEFNKNASLVNEKGVNVEFIRFEYDIEKAATAVENSILPNAFAENLRNGF